MEDLKDVIRLRDARKYVDKIKDYIDKIDDLTCVIDLKFPFKIDSLIETITDKTYDLDSFLREELKIKENKKV